jgi:hypothetical protein
MDVQEFHCIQLFIIQAIQAWLNAYYKANWFSEMPSLSFAFQYKYILSE